MKKDFRFYYKKNGERREMHVLADNYYEAKEEFFKYIDFLRYMGLDVKTISERIDKKY